MKLLQTDTLSLAREKLADQTQDFQFQTMNVSIHEVLGKVCAKDIYAYENIPPFRRSTVDGYAIKAEDSFGASETMPAFFDVVGYVSIEKTANIKINTAEAIEVQTGSMIPSNANAVVMVEYCEEYTNGKIVVHKSVSVNENIIQVGEDIQESACLIKKGHRFIASDIGVLAALGMTYVEVYNPLTITIISTGDELVDIDEPLTDSKIRDINSYALAALASSIGFVVNKTMRIQDDYDCLLESVQEATTQSDLVILSGGSSKGEKDYTRDVLDEVTHNVFTHGISIKPGKPTILSYDKNHQTILSGMPGHPMAAFLMFRLIIVDWYYEKLGIEKVLPHYATMAENVASNQGRETCLLVSLQIQGDEYVAYPIYAKSGSISSFLKADGYTLISRNKEGLQKGERVKVEVFS